MKKVLCLIFLVCAFSFSGFILLKNYNNKESKIDMFYSRNVQLKSNELNTQNNTLKPQKIKINNYISNIKVIIICILVSGVVIYAFIEKPTKKLIYKLKIKKKNRNFKKS